MFWAKPLTHKLANFFSVLITFYTIFSNCYLSQNNRFSSNIKLILFCCLVLLFSKLSIKHMLTVLKLMSEFVRKSSCYSYSLNSQYGKFLVFMTYNGWCDVFCSICLQTLFTSSYAYAHNAYDACVCYLILLDGYITYLVLSIWQSWFTMIAFSWLLFQKQKQNANGALESHYNYWRTCLKWKGVRGRDGVMRTSAPNH